MEKNRYEAVFDNKVIGVACYSFLPDFVLAVTSTEVRSEYKGKGIASALILALIKYAQFYGYKINPICPYTKAYIETHPEYANMLAPNV